MSNSDGIEKTIGAPESTDALPETLPATPVPSGVAATMVSVEPVSGVADTMAPGSASAMATLAGDYGDLIQVDPQHYVLDDEIARGGMGRIRRGRDRRLGRPVAIKELLVPDSSLRRRFEREVRITARLQHPSIVAVHEAGMWPGGEPFFAMKLVSGRPLADVIAEADTLPAKLALLPVIIAAVDALAYAHSEAYIHRDLKPGNILCGDFGETVVIDWGLAKDLTDVRSDDAAATPYRAGGHDETVVGAVMGTPAYMPPEQAAGKAVDARADVYALGAILYHLLAGQSPYTGRSGEDVVAKVIAGPPAPLDVPGLAPELATIVTKAMERSPEDRYPTAKELATDLKRFQTGQLVGAHRYTTWQLVRRWIGRHRAALTVAGVLLACLAVTAIVLVRQIVAERDDATAQRTLADSRRAGAEKLVDFMVIGLRDRLSPLGRLDLLEGVGGAIVDYYATVPDADPVALAQRAKALALLAGVELQKGKIDESERIARAALAAIDHALARTPGDAEARGTSAIIHQRLADVHRARKDNRAARDEYERARSINAELVKEDPGNRRWRNNLGSSNAYLAMVYADLGDRPAALAATYTQRDVMRALAKDLPDDVDIQRSAAMSEQNAAFMAEQAGDFETALDSYAHAHTIIQRIRTADPKDVIAADTLALILRNEGSLRWRKGDIATKARLADEAIVLLRAVVAADPASATAQQRLAIDLRARADVALAGGELDVALKTATESLELSQKQAIAQPDSVITHLEVGYVHVALATVYRRRNDLERARTSYEAALRSLDRATADDRSRLRPIWRALLGEVLAERGDHATALAIHRECSTELVALRDANPDDKEIERELGYAHYRVAGDLLATGDLGGAQRELDAALTTGLELAKKDESSLDRQSDLSDLYERMAEISVAAKDLGGAIASHRKALAIREHLAATRPLIVPFQGDLARSLRALARLLAKDDPAEAKRLAGRGREVLERLRAANRLPPSLDSLDRDLAAAAR